MVREAASSCGLARIWILHTEVHVFTRREFHIVTETSGLYLVRKLEWLDFRITGRLGCSETGIEVSQTKFLFRNSILFFLFQSTRFPGMFEPFGDFIHEVFFHDSSRRGISVRRLP